MYNLFITDTLNELPTDIHMQEISISRLRQLLFFSSEYEYVDSTLQKQKNVDTFNHAIVRHGSIQDEDFNPSEGDTVLLIQRDKFFEIQL